MVDDQNPQDPQAPVSATDQSASLSAVASAKEDSDTNRPDSTTLADPSQSATTDDRPISTNLADPTTTSADSTNPTSDSPSIPIEPVSTQMADSTIPSPSEQSTSTDNQPEPTVSTDPSQVPTDLSAITSAQIDSQPVSVTPTEPPAENVSPAPVPEETSIPTQTPISTSPIISSPDLSDSTNLNNPLPINVSPPEIKPVEVQSDAPSSTPTITQSQAATESASIKPEPPEQPLEAPLANNDSQNSTPKSFGDLLSGNTNQPASPPSASLPDLGNVNPPSVEAVNPSDLPVSSSSNPQPIINNPFTPPKPDVSGEGGQPSSSFGDLIKDIKPEEPVIQPSPVPPTSPPISLPVTNFQPLTTNISSPNLSVNRIKANQARIQKKAVHLQKILDLAKGKGKITNKDIRNLLRVSQSTATNYLSELVHRGSLKIEKHAKATFYTI